MAVDDVTRLTSDVARLRALLADTSADEPAAAATAAALSYGLTRLGMKRNDPTLIDEVAGLLRDAHERTPNPPETLTRALADALTIRGHIYSDPEAVREAEALLAALTAPATTADVDQAFEESTRAFFTALGNFVFGHDLRARVRALEIAHRLKDLAGQVGPRIRQALQDPELYANALLIMVETMGPGGGPHPDSNDELVEQCRRLLESCPSGHPARPLAESILARVLRAYAIALRNSAPEKATALTAESDRLLRDMVANAPSSDADLLRTLVDLARRDPTPEIVTADETSMLRMPPEPATNAWHAMAGLQQAVRSAATDPTATHEMLRNPLLPPLNRAHAAIGAAAGVAHENVDLALSYTEVASELMAHVTDRGSDHLSAEHALAAFEGDVRNVVQLILICALARNAKKELDRIKAAGKTTANEALIYVYAGPEVDRAAALLERGRGLLLARQLETRVDLSELHAAHPHLADRFERLNGRLAAQPEAPVSPVLPNGAPATGHTESSRLATLRTSQELDELIRQIRAEPGFEGFLSPLSGEQLRALAVDGPIVVLNHASECCHALIVTRQAVTSLRLHATPSEVTSMAQRLRESIDAFNASGGSRPSLAQLETVRAVLHETLSWVWHQIVYPALVMAGRHQTVREGGAWPRIWWIPTGAFNALPLHAAECTLPDCTRHECAKGGARSALDTVVSSYAPNFQVLAHARSRPSSHQPPSSSRALLVAPSDDELPGAAAAARFAAGLLQEQGLLIGPTATRQAVFALLSDATWAHFGYHATSDQTNPSGSLLHLPGDEPISILEICRTRTSAARLAFLAACGTARSSDRLADEAIHITSAFLIAGFPEAIGTLWEVDSTYAQSVTQAFYQRAIGENVATPAHALHQTIRELRNPKRPYDWAAWVHAGA